VVNRKGRKATHTCSTCGKEMHIGGGCCTRFELDKHVQVCANKCEYPAAASSDEEEARVIDVAAPRKQPPLQVVPRHDEHWTVMKKKQSLMKTKKCLPWLLRSRLLLQGGRPPLLLLLLLLLLSGRGVPILGTLKIFSSLASGVLRLKTAERAPDRSSKTSTRF
jgi:hypothetical protein